MRHTLALIRMELARLFLSRRWFAAVAMWGLVGKLAADEVRSHAFNTGIEGWSVFDVHAALVNNMFFVGFLLLTTFVMIACDSLARDRETRLAHVVMARAGNRWRWWAGKAVPMILAAVVFQLGVLGASLAVAVYEGGEVTREPSAFARGETGGQDATAQLFFTPADPGADMLVREVGTSLYLSLGFTAIGMAALALTARFPVSWLPGLASVGIVLLDRILSWFIHGSWYSWVSPSARLLEAMHSAAVVTDPLPLWSSLLWWVVLLVLSAIVGVRTLQRVDI